MCIRDRNYTYDANSRRTAMVYRHGVAAIDYGYENGRLATLGGSQAGGNHN